MEARVCQCGCGRELRLKNGDPDFKRRFYSKECLSKDKRRRTAFARELHRRKRVSTHAPEQPPRLRAGRRFWIRGRAGSAVGVLTLDAAHAIAGGLGKDLVAVLIENRPKAPSRSGRRPTTNDRRLGLR